MIGVASISILSHTTTSIMEHHLSFKEPKIGLLEKFDGTRSKFWRFINQVQLVIELQPQSYPTQGSQVKFIRTLLWGSVLSWFLSFFERRDLILDNLEAFLVEFQSVYGGHDIIHVATNKICVLQ